MCLLEVPRSFKQILKPDHRHSLLKRPPKTMCRSDTNQQLHTDIIATDTNPPFNPAATHDMPPQYKSQDHIGNPLTVPKDPHITRILFKNPDGIALGHELEMMLEECMNMDVDQVVFPETKLDTSEHWVHNKIHDHCRRIVGQGRYRLVTAASPIKFHTPYKPGGVMAVTIGHLSGRVVEMGTDEMGRWVYIRYSCSGEKKVTLIGVYQPCDQNVKTVGPTTATAQQYSLLKQHNKYQPQKVRHHYSMDLVAFVKECQNNEELVCVGGDFNETLGDEDNGLTRLMNQCGLVDVHYETHGIDTHTFNTHKRGSRCIDYALMDPALMDSIEACGYMPFKYRIQSDHRGVYLDVITNQFFGSTTIPLPPAQLRLLNSRRINQIHPYFEKLEQHLETHNWYTQIQRLQDYMSRGIRDDDLAEKLDRRRIAGCQWAASQLQQYPAPPYSPEIADLRMRDAILKSAISQLLDPQDDYDTRMEQLQSKLHGTGMDLPPTIEECRLLRRQNLRQLRALERDEIKTGASRRTHQNSLIDMYAAAGKTLTAKVIRRIQKAEETARVWKQCAAARGLTKTGGIAHVLVPEDPNDDVTTCQNWMTLDDPKEVRRAIAAQLQKHFSQAKDCNLTSPPLDITMDFEGTCHKAEAILNGTLDTSDMNVTTQWVMAQLQFLAGSQDAVDWELSEHEFIGKIKSWDERTSTSPATGVHLGHAKAYCSEHPFNKDSKEEAAFEKRRGLVLAGHLILMNYSLQFGYSYDRWQIIINSLLEKDPGSPKVHRLRVIHLYEWDFNLLLAVKWRRLLHRVCDLNMINQGCYGSMPGRTTLDPVFIREMEYELCRLVRQPMVHFDNDAKSCYDRIPCFLANVASRKYGMHHKVCTVQGKTLREAKYYLKTKFGLSDEHVSHTSKMPWFGTGQGSGNSPMYWLVISSTLFDVYQQKATGGATYQSPDGTLTMQIYQLGFVDDVMNRTSMPWDTTTPHESLTDLIHQASLDSQLWHDLLESCNQTLELQKCKYHVIHYDFADNGKPILQVQADPPAPLAVNNASGQPITITHVPNDKAIKYLGFHKCIDNQTQQRAALLKKANDYARAVNCSPLSRRGANTFYRGIYQLSVGYVLPLTYFTNKELNQIQKQAHRAFVAKCGYNRNTNLAVVYGPRALGGLGFFHLYDLQGYGQIECFIKYWRTPNSQPGRILRIVMSWIQYCAGVGWSILDNTKKAIPHLESTWITSMRTYMATIEAKIQMREPMLPPLQRQNDSYIMDHVLDHEKFTPANIKAINWCRIYLGVVTISDMTNANGTHILQAVWEGNLEAMPTRNTWLRVHQRKPNAQSWRVWRQACRLVATAKYRILHQRLGHWTVQAAAMRHHWPTWQVPRDDFLYMQNDTGAFGVHPRLTQDFDEDPQHVGVALPADAVPVDVARLQHTWRVTHNRCRWALPRDPPPPPNQLQAFIHQLPEWEQQLLQGITWTTSQASFMNIVNSASVIVAADGSVKGSQASFGWVISTQQARRIATCSGPAYGAKPRSYRGEGYGILSVLRFVFHLQTQWHVKVRFCLVCDNQAMVNRSNEQRDVLTANPNSTMERLLMRLRPSWVIKEEFLFVILEQSHWRELWLKVKI